MLENVQDGLLVDNRGFDPRKCHSILVFDPTAVGVGDQALNLDLARMYVHTYGGVQPSVRDACLWIVANQWSSSGFHS
jgi:hypothetical protein